MDANDLKTLFAEANKRMNVTLEHVKHELAGVRTGRASVTILDPVHVEAYGTRMPLNQVAGLSVPEPTMIVVQPFDQLEPFEESTQLVIEDHGVDALLIDEPVQVVGGLLDGGRRRMTG